MRQTFCSLILFIAIILPALAIEDSRWILTIQGKDKVEFGTEQLAGGLNIHWQTKLEFTIQNDRFNQGTGTATFVGDITTFSRPAEMFDCKLVNGIFSNRNGISFSTPHLRYKAFPLTGKIVGDKIQLNPFLEYPGNYYAVLYQCETSNELGSFWIERSPRIARELSKRQDATITFEESIYRARIKEINSISPGPQMELPLIDGFKFSVTQQYGLRTLNYSLSRVSNN